MSVWGTSFFPTPLVCITIEHIIDEVDSVEGYLATSSPEDTAQIEQCIPRAVRQLLEPAATMYGFDPRQLNTDMIRRSLEALWFPGKNIDKLYRAAEVGAGYIIPYILTPEIPLQILTAVQERAASRGQVDFLRSLRIVMKTIGGESAFKRNWRNMLISGASGGYANLVDYVLNEVVAPGELDQAFLDTLIMTISASGEQGIIGKKNYERATRLILNAGGDPSYQEYQPVLNAAQYGGIGMIKAMLAADPTLRVNPVLSLALNTALKYGRTDIVNLLRSLDVPELDAELIQFIGVVLKGIAATVGRFLQSANPLDLDRYTHFGKIPVSILEMALWLAVRMGHQSVVHKLLQYGTNVVPIIQHLPHSYTVDGYLASLRLMRSAAIRTGDRNVLRVLDDEIKAATPI